MLSGISSITEFPLPSGALSVTQMGAVQAITTGPDGNLWFTEPGTHAIGMINPTTHAISSFTVPTADATPQGITSGPNGNLWFTEGGVDEIGEINPTTHAITEFSIPTITGAPTNITTGPDGNLWFTEPRAHQIGVINPTTGANTEFATPEDNPGGAGITAGPDGDVWFTWEAMNSVNPTTHVITQDSTDISWGLAVGPDGNLWFTEGLFPTQSGVGMFNPTTDTTTDIPSSTGSPGTYGITAGPDGNMWFTQDVTSSTTGDFTTGNIAQVNLTTDAITEYTLPNSASTPYSITSGPDGNIWFDDPGTDSIGVATLTSSQLVVTSQPPASVTAGTPFSLTVEAENSSGSVLSSFNGPVTVAIASGPSGATLGGTLTATATDGVATFSGLSLTEAASGYTLDVSGTGLGSGVTGAITVTPAAASQVVITQEPPSSVTAGSGFGLQASIEDQYGNVVTSATNTVSVALATGPSGASLGGTLAVSASQGVATFSGLTLTKAASGYTLQVSSAGFSSTVSTALTVTPAAAASLMITEEPTSVVVGTSFTLVVEVVDAYGNVVTSDDNTVSLALGKNPSGAKLGGTTSMKFVNGVATFTGLSLNKVGTGYTILISSKDLDGVTTNPFNVIAS